MIETTTITIAIVSFCIGMTLGILKCKAVTYKELLDMRNLTLDKVTEELNDNIDAARGTSTHAYIALRMFRDQINEMRAYKSEKSWLQSKQT